MSPRMIFAVGMLQVFFRGLNVQAEDPKASFERATLALGGSDKILRTYEFDGAF